MVEGNSIRSIVRNTGTGKDACFRLIAEVGEFCATCLCLTLRKLPWLRVEADEVRAF